MPFVPFRVMIDSSVYELLVLEETLIPKIVSSRNLVVYGCRVVRKELRETPPHKKVGSKKLKILMLNTYSLLVKKHDVPISDLAGSLYKNILTNTKAEFQGKNFTLIS